MTDISIDGMALAPGVVETIVFIAANEVEGVASVGLTGASGLRSRLASKGAAQGIQIEANDDDTLHISVRVEVLYGYPLPDVAARIRSSVADAVLSQVGIPVSSVDIYIDSIRFEN